MAARPIGIALIGYGGIGRVHAMGWRSLLYHYAQPSDSLRIVGVATRHPESAAAAAREIGCDLHTTDWKALIARDDVDIVDCCTPNRAHEPVAQVAAETGTHLYCEKPLAVDVAQGRRMVAAAAQAGIQTQMTFNFRFLPAIMRAQQLLQENFLGRIFSFRGSYYRSSYIDPAKPLSWRLRKAESGGGALFDIGSHLLDLVYLLLGDFAAVQGTLETLIDRRPRSAGSTQMATVDVDDLALLRLRMASGVLGQVDISRMGTGATNNLSIEIFGDRGALRFDSNRPSILDVFDCRDANGPIGGLSGYRSVQTSGRYAGQKMPDWTMPPDFVRSHAECQHRFIEAIRANRPSAPTIADGLKIQEVMAAAQRSSEERRWVALSELE